MNKKPWLAFALVTTLFWGAWGALVEIPEKAGFPETLGYIVWALTMVPCALVGLGIVKWKLEYDKKSIFYGLLIGLTGAGGQLILFHALVKGPAYLVFPVISLSPVLSVVLSLIFLKETTTRKQYAGIILALTAIVLMSYQVPDDGKTDGFWWFVLSCLVFLTWGIQAFLMKIANNMMKAESIFFYMMVSGLLLVPVAFIMTDMSREINWGFKGPYLTAIIQVLNSIGALTLVYAMRFGKVIIVAPLTNAIAPVITVVISLVMYAIVPHPVIIGGIGVAMTAAFFIAD